MSVETPSGIDSPRWWKRLLPMAAVALSFTISSFVRYPVPGPNEAHYLCKAKHYWQPDWCARDLFLSSSNAHLVFYQTFGSLTEWCSLETTAIIGRVVGLLILAAGWTAMIHRLVPGQWPPLWAAWIFVGLSAAVNLSGEWLIGGIEAKVPAYGFLFAAIGLGLDDRRRRRAERIVAASFLFGLAISFHPVIGLWGLGAAVFATLIKTVTNRLTGTRAANGLKRWWLLAGLVMVLVAAPGVVAALKSTTGSSASADYIQVYYRLVHHLDPVRFEYAAWIIYGALMIAWLFARRIMARREPEKWFFWFVIGAGLIALAGFVIGWRSGPPEKTRSFLFSWLPIDFGLRWKLLKLYPFRLFDVLLPIAFAAALAGVMRRWCEVACSRAIVPHRRTLPLIWLLCAAPAVVAVLHPAADARPAMNDEELADWLDVCGWVERNTPRNSLIFTPPQESWAFKWFAQRAEYVSYKDCPQDGKGIVEWNRRLLFLHDWAEQKFPGGYTVAETRPLREQGISHIVAKRLGPFEMPPIYENETFRVYKLQDPP